jgi:aryl carrier-like protein
MLKNTNHDAVHEQRTTTHQETNVFVAPRDNTEEHVARLAAELLDSPRIGVTDNLFDHGIQSLQISQLLISLKKQFGAMPSLDDMYLNPTIQDLARILRSKFSRCIDVGLLEIRAKGDRPALFLVNSSSRSALYEPLARRLDPNQPVCELTLSASAIADYRQLPYIHLEAIAERHVHAISSVQRFGPYLLGGYRSGGLLAMEVANQLRMQGHDVALVAMFGHVPSHLSWPSRSRFDPLRLALTRVGHQLLKALAGLFPSQACYPLIDSLRRASGNLFVHCAIRGAVSRYVTNPYSGRIAWFVASEGRRKQTRAYIGIASNQLEVYHVPSRENRMLSQPQVCEVAKQVTECLASVQGVEKTEAPS